MSAKGDQQHLSGDATDLRRSMHNIAEDQENDIRMMQEDNWPWEARAAYLTVIGVSNTVRMIGSLIGSFFAIVTRPLNEQSIGFENEGEYLIRCVATPIASDEAKADPDHHVIRASSVAVLPIRVQNLSRRADENLGLEDRALAALEAEVAAARTDDDRSLARAKLAAFQTSQAAGGLDTLKSAAGGIRAQLVVAETLERLKRLGTPESEWELDAINLEIALLTSRVNVEDHLARLHAQLKLVAGEGAGSATDQKGSHERWAREQTLALKDDREVRPRIALASEENGQVTGVLAMLGELDESTEAVKKWRLIDITGGGSRDYYTARAAWLMTEVTVWRSATRSATSPRTTRTGGGRSRSGCHRR